MRELVRTGEVNWAIGHGLFAIDRFQTVQKFNPYNVAIYKYNTMMSADHLGQEMNSYIHVSRVTILSCSNL